MRCLPKWGASNAGVTKFTLTKATNSGGIIFTKAQFQMERKLTEQELALVESLTESVKLLSQNVMHNVRTGDIPMEKPVAYADEPTAIGA